MHALVTGATGFIGRRLMGRLRYPLVVSRDPERARPLLNYVNCYRWDAESDPPPVEAFDAVEAIFHLAGEPVAEGRWTEEKKRRIRDSRVLGTRHLVDAIESLHARPKVLVAASAVGIYGSRGDEELDEASSPGDDFLAEVCKDWESEAQRAEELGVRVVNLRIGIVLGPSGGALARMLPLFRKGLGGRLGNGHQWMPWVHLDDLVDQMLHAAQAESIRGPLNGVAPVPVTNREFTRTLAQLLRRPAFLPAPPLALKLGLGEFATALLASQRVVPRVACENDFAFRYPRLEGALRAILAMQLDA